MRRSLRTSRAGGGRFSLGCCERREGEEARRRGSEKFGRRSGKKTGKKLQKENTKRFFESPFVPHPVYAFFFLNSQHDGYVSAVSLSLLVSPASAERRWRMIPRWCCRGALSTKGASSIAAAAAAARSFVGGPRNGVSDSRTRSISIFLAFGSCCATLQIGIDVLVCRSKSGLLPQGAEAALFWSCSFCRLEERASPSIRGSPFYFLALTPLSFSPSSLNSINNFRQPSLRRATCAPRARRSWRDR